MCATALQLAGVWVQRSARVHVGVPRTASRLRWNSRTLVHWHPWPGAPRHSVDTVSVALATATTCLPPEQAVASIDSALNRRLVSLVQLEEAFALFPLASRAMLMRADVRCESGLESIVCFRLRALRVHFRIQVVIPGVGRVDVFIGDRLILELDGFAFHSSRESFESDRRRDLALQALGYRVIRLSYERAILSMVPPRGAPRGRGQMFLRMSGPRRPAASSTGL